MIKFISNGALLYLRVLVVIHLASHARFLAHFLQTGVGRIVAGLTDPSLEGGVFYASAKATGPVIDQSEIFPDLTNPVFQEHADEAIHQFL